MTSPQVDKLLLRVVAATKSGNRQEADEAKARIEHALMTRSLKRRVLERRMKAIRAASEAMKN